MGVNLHKLREEMHVHANQAETFLSNSLTKGTESSKGLNKLKIIGSNIANIAIVKAHRVVYTIMSTVYSNPEWINNKNITDKVEKDISDLRHIIKDMKPSTNEGERAANLATIDLIQECIKEAKVVVDALKNSGAKENVTKKLKEDLSEILRENEKKLDELEGPPLKGKEKIEDKGKEKAERQPLEWQRKSQAHAEKGAKVPHFVEEAGVSDEFETEKISQFVSKEKIKEGKGKEKVKEEEVEGREIAKDNYEVLDEEERAKGKREVKEQPSAHKPLPNKGLEAFKEPKHRARSHSVGHLGNRNAYEEEIERAVKDTSVSEEARKNVREEKKAKEEKGEKEVKEGKGKEKHIEVPHFVEAAGISDELETEKISKFVSDRKVRIGSKIEEAQILAEQAKNLEEEGDSKGAQAKNALAIRIYQRLLENEEELDSETRNEVKLLLGIMLETSYPDPKTRKEGIKYVREAAEGGQRQAIEELAFYYKNGIEGVVEKDLKEQAKWKDLKKANNVKYKEEFNKGMDLYDNGEHAEAAKHFRESAKLGSPEAMVQLAIMHESGEGVKEDLNKSVEYYQKAIRQDYAAAKYNLGILYLDSRDRSFANLEKAYVLINAAADEKVKEAVNTLGEIYEKGLKADDSEEVIVEQDYEEAFKNYKRANKLGSEEGFKNLVRCYEQGIGVEQNLDTAQKLEIEHKAKKQEPTEKK